MEATLFDGELMAGPCPSLFSDDPESTLAAILDEPIKCHWDVTKINKCFFMAESLSIRDARLFVKKPRYFIISEIDLMKIDNFIINN